MAVAEPLHLYTRVDVPLFHSTIIGILEMEIQAHCLIQHIVTLATEFTMYALLSIAVR